MAPQLSFSSVLVYFSCLCLLLFAASPSASFNGELAETSLLSIGSGFACEFAKCLRGQCVNTSSFPFYACECNSGWQSPFGASWLPCILPNCSIDLTCANRSNAITASPPAVPSFGGVSVCSLPVCGNGVCIQNNSAASNSTDDYECECNTGFVNLGNKVDGYCIHNCSIGADCTNVKLPFGGTPHAPPPPSISSPVSSSAPNPNQGLVNKLQNSLMIAASLVLAIIWG